MERGVIIAGAGPAGLLLAKELAKSGWSVQVFEARSKEGLLSHHDWSDAIDYSVLKEAGLPVPEKKADSFEGDGVKKDIGDGGLYEQHRIADLNVYSPDYKAQIKGPVNFPMILVDRAALADYQLKQAIDAGAQVYFDSTVKELTGNLSGKLGDIEITGCVIERGGKTETIKADLVVDATGHVAALRQKIDNPVIAAPFAESEFAHVSRKVYHYEKLSSEKYPHDDHYCYGKNSGYSWTHYHRDGLLDIGSGISTQFPASLASETREDMAKSIGVGAELRGVKGVSERVLVGASPLAIVTNGFIVLGDAAAMTNSMNGCGVAGALRGAMLAADTLKGAKDCTITTLWPTARKWFTDIGAHYAALRAMSRALQALTHDDVRFMISKGILDAEMMGNNMSGIFKAPGIGKSLRTLFACLGGHMNVLSMLMNAQSAAKKAFKHRKAYPETYEPEAFQAYCERA